MKQGSSTNPVPTGKFDEGKNAGPSTEMTTPNRVAINGKGQRMKNNETKISQPALKGTTNASPYNDTEQKIRP